ncbi:hypothetical protein Leucomu_13175 [Leucobacter muris]|uniref:Phage tail protein n=1 Tax=Leucobacter muris TaxID=1935379 RepID=A0ABX5QH99_9MICO|nr:hypothetical protein [Leucobacter muris]QAB18330.1 hypothetical protein Leucomu_10745 [Leucobacter muris]QAB18733.1 hypothetical protein Leucomu_13175 [Leucobacter muris]
MAADAEGNDIGLVGIPITGFLAWAPIGTAIPAKSEGAELDLELAAAFAKVGLIKQDGGFDWTGEASGDAIEFWQEGYSVPTGLANVTIAATLAEHKAKNQELLYGEAPDADGAADIEEASNDKRVVLFSHEVFKSGWIRRRAMPNVGVQLVKLDKSERGSVQGQAVTFKVDRSGVVGNRHYRQWIIPPAPVTP